MDISELLTRFADPATIGTLGFGDKMLAGLVATMLGMGITLLALVVLHGVIVLLGRLTAQPAPQAAGQPAEPGEILASGAIGPDTVAAITAALALALRTSPDTLVVREIKRVEDQRPSWGRVGLVEGLRSGD